MVRFLRVLKLFLVTSWFVATVALVSLIAVSAAISHLDRDLFIARGPAMEPAVPVGAAVIVRHAEPAEVSVGQVISFRQPNGMVVTHRVTALTVVDGEPAFETKGDAEAAVSGEPVPAAAVIGVAEMVVPLAGTLINELGTTFGAVAALALLGGLLLAVWFTEDVLDGYRRSSERRRILAELAH